MAADGVLLSIRPVHAEKIFQGIKTVELRRVCPQLLPGARVFVYVSAPVSAVVGYFVVGEVIQKAPHRLWRDVRHACAYALPLPHGPRPLV